MNCILKIGWGEKDITPDGRVVELFGQYYQRVANGIHSRLKATVMLLEQENEYILMISLDTIGIPESFYENVKKAIWQKFPDIFDEKIIINATHTHNAPALSEEDNWWEATPEAITCEEYSGLVIGKIIEAVQQAWDSRQIIGISKAFGFVDVGHCRRTVYSDGTAEMYGSTKRDDFIGMEGREDSGVNIMFCFDKSGNPTGCIVNVACPSQVMEATYKISSDYMGKLRELLKNRFGDNFFTLCQIAPAGCQSPRDLTRSNTISLWSEEGVEIIAQRVFNSIENEYESLKENVKYNLNLDHAVENIEIPRRRVSYQNYIDAKKEKKRLEEIENFSSSFLKFSSEIHANEKITERPGPYDSKLHHFVKICNEEAVIDRFEEQDKNPIVKMQLHVVRLDNIVFATNPFELYLDFGDRIRARSSAEQTFMIQLCNGECGYLPSARAEELGGYGGLIINGEVDSDGGTMFVDLTVQKIKDLFND